MPYIPQWKRQELETSATPKTAGELNYLISSMLDDYIGQNLSYAKINEVIGVLECAKLELYRRVAAPYENEKLEENGEVYRWTAD